MINSGPSADAVVVAMPIATIATRAILLNIF
jgi:hypothetical protein